MQGLGHYSYYIFWHPGDGCYFAVSPEFPRLSAFGDTPEEALAEFQIVLKAAIEMYQGEQWSLPEPTLHRTVKCRIVKTRVNEVPPIDFDDDDLPLGAVKVAGAGGMIFDDDD